MQKKGISLIVLVITIIVMIVLAGAVIISLSNSGIIGNANKAVKTSNEATVKELAQTAWLDAYADGVRSVEDEGDKKGFKTRVEDALRENGINLEDYLINVTTSGVTAKSIDKAWIKEDFTVIKGDKVLEIGDIVNYDETAGGTKTGLVQTQWQVLGEDDDGNLLIMSTTDISSKKLGERGNLTKCQQDWLNCEQILDKECEPYGYGKGTVGKARSIRMEDFNNMIGYDPANIDGNGTPEGAGTIDEYGNKVTYKYNGKEVKRINENEEYGILKKAYEGTNGLKGTEDSVYSSPYSETLYYYYYDGKEIKYIADLRTLAIGTTFAELTCTWYNYSGLDPAILNNEKAVKAYQMVVGSNKDNNYWLANHYIQTGSSNVYYGMPRVYEGFVYNFNFWMENGNTNYDDYYYGDAGVRAVVTLSSDIEFTGSSEEGWSY